jgi:hypothetical protein
MSDLVSEAFEIRALPGLGKAFKCKLCDCLFVSTNDAQRHLTLHHRVASMLRLQQLLESPLYAHREKVQKA